MSVGIGKHETVIARAERFRPGDYCSTGLLHLLFPMVNFFFTIGRKGQYNFIPGVGICYRSLHSGFQYILQKEMNDKTFLAKEEARQLV